MVGASARPKTCVSNLSSNSPSVLVSLPGRQTFLYAFALGRGEVHRAGIIFPATSIISGSTLSVRQLDGPTSARIAVLGLDIPQILDDLDLQYRRRSDLLATTRAAVEQLAGMGNARHPTTV
jgi:hypothetical protein